MCQKDCFPFSIFLGEQGGMTTLARESERGREYTMQN
jgi:hypothetical protein